jgi:hypothetical protein
LRETSGCNELETVGIKSEEKNENDREEEEIQMSSHLHPITVGIIKNLGQDDEYIIIN